MSQAFQKNAQALQKSKKVLPKVIPSISFQIDTVSKSGQSENCENDMTSKSTVVNIVLDNCHQGLNESGVINYVQESEEQGMMDMSEFKTNKVRNVVRPRS